LSTIKQNSNKKKKQRNEQHFNTQQGAVDATKKPIVSSLPNISIAIPHTTDSSSNDSNSTDSGASHKLPVSEIPPSVRRRKTGTPFFLSQDRIYTCLLKHTESIHAKLWEKDSDYEKAIWRKFDELRIFNGHSLPAQTIGTPVEEFQV